MNALILAQLLKDISDAFNVAATRQAQEEAQWSMAPPLNTPAPAAAPVQAAPVQAAAPMTLAVTNADVVSLFQRLYQEKGEGAVIECLRAVGINRISDANSQQLAQLHATANAALVGA